MKPLVVVAIGGNALVGLEGGLDVDAQRAAARRAGAELARLTDTHRVVLTHGNGPQVGLLAMHAAAEPTIPALPLDVLDAESVGQIGHVLLEALSSFLAPARAAVMLTRVEVDPADVAFAVPTKPVGPWLPAALADDLAQRNGWSLVHGPRGARRVVASPEPRRIVDLPALRALIGAVPLVIAGGGGGIPVAHSDGALVGVEAVVDKDLTSAMIALALDAQRLVVLTDVEAVMADHGTSTARPIVTATPPELRRQRFDPGTMGPKIEAVCRFVEQTGRPAAIGALARAADVLADRSGTHIVAH